MQSEFSQGFRLDGQVALITGAATGIGRAVAELFAEQGASLVLLDRKEEVVAAVRDFDGDHLGIVCDVADVAQISAAVNQAETHFGRIDILVNNAGVALLDAADQLKELDWDTTMAINLKAPFFLSQAVALIMVRHGRGRIINLASQASVVALQRHAAYCASKAALVSMSQVLAVEWAGRGITVNCVSPTVVETELGKKAWAGEAGEAMKRQIPLARFAQPQEIAAAILYLVSAHAGMMTGANLVIDGGYTIQ